MAILIGINTRMRGSAGDWTFAQVNGQTVAKQKVAKKAVPVRTLKIMRRRTQLGNLVNIYRAFTGHLHPSFENKDQRVSDYNEFVSANIGLISVYLTKDERRQGGCVVAPYQITRGSLPSIEVSGTTVKETDISLGVGFSISSSTTVKAFSDAVIGHNESFANGDQITCFIATQHVNSVTGVPYVTIKAQEITLDQSDSDTLLLSVVDSDGFSVANGHLAAGQAVNGGIAWIHSRNTASGTKVSTQRFVVTNTSLATYQSAAHLQAAIESYGGINKEEYLTPDNDTDVAPEVANPLDAGNNGPRMVTLTLKCATPGTGSFTVDGEPYTEPIEVEGGSTVSVHFEPAEGYELSRWRDNNSTEPDREVAVEENLTLIVETEES